ncbi:hypothetical protein L873DRAFT_1698191, partial [Choiromyces venosus 120613-1]
PPFLFSPLLSNNRHDVSHYCLQIGFTLQKSRISLQQTPSSNLHSSITLLYSSSSFHPLPTTSSLASFTLFY